MKQLLILLFLLSGCITAPLILTTKNEPQFDTIPTTIIYYDTSDYTVDCSGYVGYNAHDITCTVKDYDLHWMQGYKVNNIYLDEEKKPLPKSFIVIPK